MPIPPDILAEWLHTEVHLPEGAPAHAEPLTVPAATAPERPATPPGLLPEAWFVSAWDPDGRPASEADNVRAHGQLIASLNQTGVVWLPAVAQGEGRPRQGVVLLGVDRARAVKLAYKRRQWACLGILPGRVEVVYTGLNSRER
ncbi:MAG: DUF3293 domain-containing protein [Alphaproteobacteria bacterium]|nr:DUF3293 domain-containing protein [Alphaproteobacteria bacterium]